VNAVASIAAALHKVSFPSKNWRVTNHLLANVLLVANFCILVPVSFYYIEKQHMDPGKKFYNQHSRAYDFRLIFKGLAWWKVLHSTEKVVHHEKFWENDLN
jgi:hypothetical protein